MGGATVANEHGKYGKERVARGGREGTHSLDLNGGRTEEEEEESHLCRKLE